MGDIFDEITPALADWIGRQALFFVGTAPLAADGHVNVSPKGPIGSLRVLAPDRVAYLDVVGSGAETIAHLRENGRIVVMFCAFDGPPRILRLHGHGRHVLPHEPDFGSLLETSGFDAGTEVPEARRAIVVVDVDRVATSCGYGVPLMTYEGERPHQDLWAKKKLRANGPDALERYQDERNAESIDGLPGVSPAAARAGSPSRA